MSGTDKRQQLEALFHEVGNAHHRAFIDTDGADAEWPIWYADYMRDRLADLLGARFTKSELVYLLVGLDREIQRVAPGANWQAYYARALWERYG